MNLDMTINSLIKQLKASNLIAECPGGGEFPLKEVEIFDGSKKFPKKALKLKKQYEEELKERRREFNKDKTELHTHLEVKTKATNFGQNMEKVLPTFKTFDKTVTDCRFLGSPIDFITFNGISKSSVKSISFIEVKTGKGVLNSNQKKVKKAVEDEKVSYKVFR